jgi:beta-lactamase regulating signal transducer with metallopeptidase domain
MEWLLHTLIGNSVIAAAIASAALLALLLRRPALAHVLWLLVLVKLVTPPVLRVPVSLPWVGDEAMMTAPAEDSGAAAAAPIETAEPVTAAEIVRDPSATSASVAAPAPAIDETVRAWIGIHGVSLLPALWALGTVLYVARVILRTRGFAAVLRASQPGNPAVVAHVRDVSGRLGLAPAPEVRVIDRASSPMVAGTGGTPLLVIPALLVERLDGEQLRAVIAHELAHLRRRDHWVRWVEAFATALLWWHPLLWLTRRGLHEAEEQCCDAWVVWALPDSRRAYADALVATAGLLSESAAATLPPGASGLGQFQQLRRRLVMVMQRTTRRAMSGTGKLFAGALLLALPVMPSLAEQQPERAAAAEAKAEARPATARSADADKDAEIARLRAELNRLNLARVQASLVQPPAAQAKEERIAELKLEVQQAEQALAAKKARVQEAAAVKAEADAGKEESKAAQDESDKAKEEEDAGDKAPRTQIDAEIAKARARMREDGRRYSRAELQEAEQLYQVANKQWRSPEAKASLEQMVKKYPKFNRTGCAILYLGQYSEGEDREKYLKQAVKDFSDCYYGNGVQVGAFARYLLGHYYRDNGQVEKGNALLKEVVTKYPKSVTHRGDALAKIAKDDLETPPAPK